MGDFLKELDHIINSCDGKNPLFRGHADSKWLLESSFTRSCKKLLLGIEPHIRPSEEIIESSEYHQALFALFLLKFDILIKSDSKFNERTILEKTHDIDALYETMRRYQQYPEEDISQLIKGTFFIDWSQNKDVGLFFANFSLTGQCVKGRQANGALFVCDKTATGKTHMRSPNNKPIKVKKVIDLMLAKNNDPNNDEGFGCPLLFYPPMQKKCQRANNQDAVYWAQMDLRYDLEYMWKLQEKTDKAGHIFIKLILPYESKNECAEYLVNQKVTHSYLFPR